jgi:hypothetical protein
MSPRKIVMGLVSAFALLAAAVCMAAVPTPLSNIRHFHADCSGTFATPDNGPQSGTCKGTFIGSGATFTFTLNNILIGPLNYIGTNGTDNCAFKAGTAVITVGGSTIHMHLGGSGCAAVASVGTGRFAEAYWIDNLSSGAFSGAQGSGTFSVGFDQPSGGQLLVHIDGNITRQGEGEEEGE